MTNKVNIEFLKQNQLDKALKDIEKVKRQTKRVCKRERSLMIETLRKVLEIICLI